MIIKTEVEKVRKCFDPSVWQELVEFFKRLSSLAPAPDVMIFTSRKAISFFDAMREIGILNISCFIVSDRIQDQDLKWLIGKNVTIVDESIVSGTTLNRLIDKLNKVSVDGRKIRSIEVIAFSINKEYFEKELLKDYSNSYLLKEDAFYLKKPYHELTNNMSIKFSSNVVTALTVIPRPYCVDFPIYEKITLSESLFSFIINNSEWDSDDISSNFQKENNAFAITLSPNSTANGKFDRLVGCNLSRQSLLKIRIYGNNLNHDKLELQFVPMVIMQPISIEDVENLFEQMIINHKANNIKCFFSSETAKLRLLQYLTSSFLFKSFFRQFSQNLRKLIEPKIDKEKVQYVFHPDSISKIIEICNTSSILFSNYKITPIHVPNIKDDEIRKIDPESDDILSIQSALTAPFIRLYDEKEKKARELVLKFKSNVFNIPEYKNIINRLNEGYSIVYLKEILEPISKNIDVKRFVSIFLDKSIDRGILVPILANSSNIYYRAFRHGEDVLFGIKEENLCAHLFKKYTEIIEDDEINHLWAEKMLVFFIKYGAKQGFLSQKFDDESNNAYRISIKNYLHGPIAVKNSQYNSRTYLNPENQSIWLTSILVNKAILSKPYIKRTISDFNPILNISSNEIFENSENKNQNKKYKFNRNVPIHDFHDSQTVNNAKKIGDIFGQLKRNASKKETPRLSKDIDLAILAACLTPDTVCGALAAEINLFQYHWTELMSNLSFDETESSHFLLHRVRTIKQNDLYTAINSGQAKYFYFIDKAGEKIIKNIQSEYEGTGYEYVWIELWPQNMNWTYESVSSDLISIIQMMGLYLVITNIYIRILYICCTIETKNNKKSINKEIMALLEYKDKLEICKQISNKIISIKEHKNYFERLIEELRIKEEQQKIPKYIDDFISDVNNGDVDYSRRILYLFKSINNLSNYSAKQILSKVDETISLYGKEKSFKRYNNVLFFTFERSSSKSERANGWQKFSEVKEDFYYYYQSEISFLDIPMSQNKMRYGRFLCVSSKDITNIFVLVHKFLVKLNEFNVRIVLFSDLTNEYSIVQMNSNSNQDLSFNFFFDIATPIIGSLIKDYKKTEFVFVRNEKYKQKFEIPKYLESNLEINKKLLHKINIPIATQHESFTYLFKTENPMKNDVFVSYNHNDAPCVDTVKCFLKKHNVSLIIDSENLPIGESIPQFIKSSVKNTNITLSFVSTKSIESVWVALESAYTLQLSEFSDKKFITCLLDDKIFDPQYKIEIVNCVDEKIKQYQNLINISLKKKIGIEDYAEDLSRYKNLRDNIDKIINYIKNHLAVDFTKGITDTELNKLLNVIKPVD